MSSAEKMAEESTITVRVQTPTPEKLARYGTVLGYNPDIEPLPIEFYGGAAKVRGPFLGGGQPPAIPRW